MASLDRFPKLRKEPLNPFLSRAEYVQAIRYCCLMQTGCGGRRRKGTEGDGRGRKGTEGKGIGRKGKEWEGKEIWGKEGKQRKRGKGKEGKQRKRGKGKEGKQRKRGKGKEGEGLKGKGKMNGKEGVRKGAIRYC